jgi:hypothetical protein|tara:strand:+ start:166 stop:375 length:210 start_codon:yes stop_codon:yes gene_type:complete
MNKQEIWELIRDYGAGKYYGRLLELNEKLLKEEEQWVQQRKQEKAGLSEEITNEMYHYADWVIKGDEEE